MNKEALKTAGFTDEQITQIVKLHNETLANTYVPLTRFNEVNEKLKSEEEKVKERDKQMESLKKIDAEGLQAEIERLKGENSKKDKEAKEALDMERKKNAIKLAWIEDEEYEALDSDYILEKIDLTKVELDESGKIKSGHKEQRDNLIKERPGLFKAKTDSKDEGQSGSAKSKFLGKEPADGDKKQDINASSFGAALAKKSGEKLGKPKTIQDINPWG